MPCRLTSHPEGYAAVADEAGLLRYIRLQDRSFSTESVYQLQYGSELVYQNDEPVEVPCMIDRPWTSFDFVPGKARTVLFHQSGSSKLLYVTLPGDHYTSSPVLLFGSHTGQDQCLSSVKITIAPEVPCFKMRTYVTDLHHRMTASAIISASCCTLSTRHTSQVILHLSTTKTAPPSSGLHAAMT